MDEKRVKRYGDKVNLIVKRIDEISEWVDTSLEDFLDDEKTKLATYKAFQEIAEASMDIIAMMCRDLKLVPKDDYTNIGSLGDKVISRDIARALTQSNGLRNRLVHMYNKTDDSLALESMKELLPSIEIFVEDVKKWIQGILKG